jgi:tRNA (guanine37-N1)-methyltransferase
MEKKSKALKVKKKKTQQAIELLDAFQARARQLKPKTQGQFVFIPVVKVNKEIELAFKKKKIDFKKAEAKFTEQPGKELSLKEALAKKLKPKELELAITSYNVLGDVAVIEVPEELKGKEKLIAETLLKTNKKLKTVLKKSGVTTGEFRVHPVKFLAGEKKTTALYKESGCQFKVSLGQVFFSVRLAKERMRIAKLIKKGETVAVLFAGVGPFAIVFAKNSPLSKALAVELNPTAIKEMQENIKLNKVSAKVEAFEGDVKDVVPNQLKGLCDRAVMPLPKGGESFLREAIQCLKPKGGVIHFYQFVDADKPFEKPLQAIEKACRAEKRKFTVLRKIKVRSFSPKTIQVVVDFKVK